MISQLWGGIHLKTTIMELYAHFVKKAYLGYLAKITNHVYLKKPLPLSGCI